MLAPQIHCHDLWRYINLYVCAVVDLVTAVMSVVYQHLLSARDVLVCIPLLQLFELRARNWRSDSSADQFYNSRRLMFAHQQVLPAVDFQL